MADIADGISGLYRELWTDYRIYLRDGIPGVIVLIVGALSLCNRFGPQLVDACDRLQPAQGTTTLACHDPVALLVPVGILSVILAPGVGLAANSLGFLTLEDLITKIKRQICPWGTDYAAEETDSWLTLHKHFPSIWERYDRVDSAAVLTRTHSFFLFGGALWTLSSARWKVLTPWMLLLGVAFLFASAKLGYFAVKRVVDYARAARVVQ